MKKVNINSSSNKVSTESAAISNALVYNLKNSIKRVKASYNEVVDGRKLYELATDTRKVVKIDGWEEFFLVADEDDPHYEMDLNNGKGTVIVKPCYIVFSDKNKLNTSSARQLIRFWLKKIWCPIWRPEGLI